MDPLHQFLFPDIIQQMGKDVTNLSIGDKVGMGFFHSSCGTCAYCLDGADNLCLTGGESTNTNLDQGSFSTYGVWKAAFVFKIPASIAPEHAAPLMCGGATVFHVLRSFDIKPTDRVGVIGIGGLGHLAIQFAAKMGCEVVVFSSTEGKREEATKLGASQFVVTKGKPTLDIGAPIHHLIITTSQPPDWKQFVPLLASRAVIYPLTVSAEYLTILYTDITFKELRIQGSLVAPRRVYLEMLRFADVHGIRPIVETFPMGVEGITEAMERLNSGKMRYRGVLVV
jgi:D-arabinose 1-dehydrogenase-like Zn-dependent alcohol dehydrogenase